MKIWTWGIALAFCAMSVLATRSANAQYVHQGYESQGTSGYYDQAAPEPAPISYAQDGYGQQAAPMAAASYGHGAAGCASCGDGSCGGGCANGYGGCQGGQCGGCSHCSKPLNCADEDPWQLFGGFNDNCNNITVSGWVNGGVTFNRDAPPSGYNGVTTFNDRDTEGQLNQAYITLEKALDASACCWDFGGRIDVLYGTDSRFTESRGLEKRRDLTPHWNGEPFYGLALPQAYAEVGYGDLSVKVGHFYTIIGYESVMAVNNFFYSHAYTMQYGEPFTHTGALASYAASDGLTLLAGFDRGWDNWEDDNTNRLSALGGFTWTNGCGTSFALTGTAGNEPTATGGGVNPVTSNRYMYSAVLSHDFTDRLTYVLQHDLGNQEDAVNGNTQNAEWYGVNQYLFYKLNCCWTAGARFEWFRDDDGFRVAGIGSRNNGIPPINGNTFTGDFYELTVGLNWKPTDNLTVRPEARFDWFDGVTNGGATGPFNDGTANTQTLFAIDAYLTY